MPGWNFPLNNGGSERGINDEGLEHFRSRPIGLLGREICQNSLDAGCSDEHGPVRVSFGLQNVSVDGIPGVQQLKESMQACSEYWKEHEKTRKFFNSAIQTLSGSLIPVLRISDFNTTGILGARKVAHSDWHNLIKSIGVSEKGVGKGGSFGIGKSAPFNCSKLRTVFYSTLDADGVYAFQGVARLVTHLSIQCPSEKTQGIGYYGIEDGNLPILELSEIPDGFLRTEPGTDVVVVGFNYPESWKDELAKSVLSDFFLAIHERHLEVLVGDIEITRTSLLDLVEKFSEGDAEFKTAQYYDCLISGDHQKFEEDLDSLGKLELYIKRVKNGTKRVAMFRDIGMLIKEKKHFRTPIRFSGVFIPHGEALNLKLKSLEPPRHDDWSPERVGDDPSSISEAEKFIKAIYKWVNDKVKKVVQAEQSDSVDAAGMGRYLPDEFDEGQAFENGDDVGEPDNPIIVELPSVETKPKQIDQEKAADAPGDEGDSPAIANGRTAHTGDGGEPVTEAAGGGQGEEDGGRATDSGEKSAPSRRPPSLKRYRTFCTDPKSGIYRVVVVPSRSGEAYLQLRLVGEEGTDVANLKEATLVETGDSFQVDGNGRIGPIAFEVGKRHVLEVTLTDGLRCALEVDIHAS